MNRRRYRYKKGHYCTVAQTAAMLGISKQTLLRYEAKGLFPKARRNPFNRWREYSDDDIRHLRRLMEH
jgi:DNA-binding transcriptional MerR regulator